MISKKELEAFMPMVERSREDKVRDKKKGYKEGSPADMKADKAQAMRMAKMKAAKKK